MIPYLKSPKLILAKNGINWHHMSPNVVHWKGQEITCISNKNAWSSSIYEETIKKIKEYSVKSLTKYS